MAVESRNGKLFGFKNAQLLKEFLLAQLIQFIGEILQLCFGHFQNSSENELEILTRYNGDGGFGSDWWHGESKC